MSSETKMKSLGTGAIIGVIGMSVSGISDAVFKTRLGYEKFGFVKLLQVGFITGISSASVLFFHEKVWEKILDKLNGN